MRNKQIVRIIGKLPTIAACAYRHRIGRPYNLPAENLSYSENFLYMLDRLQVYMLGVLSVLSVELSY